MLAAPEHPNWVMEPDLTAQQLGAWPLVGTTTDDRRRLTWSDTGAPITVVRRPNVLPVARTPDGDQWAWPKILAEAFPSERHFRAYLIDPNYMKTVAPAAAIALRNVVNNHPLLSQSIQFNSSGSGVLTPFLSQTGILSPADPSAQD